MGWRNIRHLRAGIELTPWKGLPLVANYHSWWLNETRDALYAAGGAVLARVPAGAASAHVGQELDIQATRALTPQLQLAAGYAHIFTGRLPEGGDARRVLQPPVRHGDLRVPRREVR